MDAQGGYPTGTVLRTKYFAENRFWVVVRETPHKLRVERLLHKHDNADMYANARHSDGKAYYITKSAAGGLKSLVHSTGDIVVVGHFEELPPRKVGRVCGFGGGWLK